MKRPTSLPDDCGNAPEQEIEDKYDNWQEAQSEREREEIAEQEYINEKNPSEK